MGQACEKVPDIVHVELGCELDPIVALLDVKVHAVDNHLCDGSEYMSK